MNDSPLNIRILPGAEVLEHINCAYVARRFFNRSRSWFIHRLNNNIVNGKPVSFTDAELRTLRSALRTLSNEILNYSESSLVIRFYDISNILIRRFTKKQF